MAYALINKRTQQTLATALDIAVTRTARRTGLLNRAGLPPSAGLLLAPCFVVHTAAMRFPIDVLFVDRGGQVVRVVRRLKPWRIAGARRAFATIELAAGALDKCDVVAGDDVQLTTVPMLPHLDFATAVGKCDFVHQLVN